MSYVDKLGREILIEENGDIIAFHNNKEVGRIEIDSDDLLNGTIVEFIAGMNVDQEYRHSGIATEMMTLVAEIYGKDIKRPKFNAVGGSNVPSHIYLTQDGAGLIRHCIAKDILIDTENSDLSIYDREDFADDDDS